MGERDLDDDFFCFTFTHSGYGQTLLTRNGRTKEAKMRKRRKHWMSGAQILKHQ